MLILPIKRKWFDMILSGEKKEEYRDIKPYYDTRLMDAFGMIWERCTDNMDRVLTIGRIWPGRMGSRTRKEILYFND